MSAPNAELAYKVLGTARAAQSLEMGRWASGAGLITLADLTTPTCGTTACLAGWTLALAGYAIKGSGAVYNSAGGYVGRAQVLAAEMLGITWIESDRLFFADIDELDAALAEIFGPRPSSMVTDDHDVPLTAASAS